MSGGYGSLLAFWVGGVGFTESLPEDTATHVRISVTGLKIEPAGSVVYSIGTAQ